jgi:DNA repair exonuclease SbcCD nuclease subunit
MKFLHAADIHLDSPLAGLARRAVVPPHVTHDCTRRAFTNLVDIAITEDVAFVVIAGDLFDADWKDFSSGLFLAREMRRLGRPCVVIRGNHDAASLVTKSLTPPDNMRMLSSRTAESFPLPEHGVVVHGRSFPDRAVPEDFSADYPAPIAGKLNIGLLHTSAENPGEHETYAPCRIEGLGGKGYDYWALGHIHARRVLHEAPHIVFPGNIQGRNPRETGVKGVTLVEVQDHRVVSIEHRPTDVLRWAQVEVDATGAEARAEIAQRMRFALAAAQGEADGRPLIARVTLSGPTICHAALLADPDQADAECRNAAAAIADDLHIERVRIATIAPDAARHDRGALAELEAAFRDALDDAEVQRRLLDDFRKLAAGLFEDLPELLPRTPDDLRHLLPEAWETVARNLAATPTPPG